MAADVPADGRPVVVQVRMRRMRCPALSCPVQRFREQVPGVPGRYQRRTVRLADQAGEVVRRLAGRAGLLAVLGIPLARDTALRILLRLPLPEVAVPRVLGAGDFALRRGQVYATVLTGAQTGQRAGVLASRRADVLVAWLREHPGAEIVCRDGSGAYGEAVRRALPGAVQAGDRWHLWHSLGEAVLKEVAAHSACWAGRRVHEPVTPSAAWPRAEPCHKKSHVLVMGNPARRNSMARCRNPLAARTRPYNEILGRRRPRGWSHAAAARRWAPPRPRPPRPFRHPADGSCS